MCKYFYKNIIKGWLQQASNVWSYLKIPTGGLLISILASCASQNISLNPTLDLTENDIGRGIELSVSSFDHRTDKLIGYRKEGFLFSIGKITVDQDLPELFSAKISDAFASMGFFPKPYSNDVPLHLRIDITKFNYYKSRGWNNYSTMAIIRATATNTAEDKSSTYNEIYLYEIELKTNVIPWADKKEELLNDTVAGVIRKLVMDQDLIAFLLHSG